MKELFPGLVYYDRGIFSKATLNEKLFQNKNSQEWYQEKEAFYNLVKSHSDTLYIILDASPATCQRRIKERGDSLEEEFHTKEDLIKFSERFYELCEICDDLPNVMWVCTTEW
jgi:deoxyadenosine/deoxycytidine kinase